MPTISDWTDNNLEDGSVIININPPSPIGGLTFRYLEQKRLGGISGTIIKSMASGYYGVNVSGMDIVNSGTGIIKVQVNSADTSGLDPGAYAYIVECLSSGTRTPVAAGYRLQYPGATT